MSPTSPARWYLAPLAAVVLLAAAPAHAEHPVTTDDCGRCHTSAGWQKLPEKVAFDHDTTRFPLRGLHTGVACTKCHGEGLRNASGTPTACARCHEDKHQGQQGRDCERCHAPTGWRIATTILDHRTTRFPLAGAHIAADCTSCHQRAREGVYVGTPTHCFGCHADSYRRTDVHPNHMQAGFTTSCDFCHTEYTWEMPRLRHELFFPLQGAHATAACTDCHKGERYGGTSHACVTCHKSDYNAAADPPHASTRMPLDCERCHSPVSWSAMAGGWHEASFPINSGHHTGFSCSQCHTRKGSYLDFSCMNCHERNATTGGHGGVGGFVYENHACWACHPDGEN